MKAKKDAISIRQGKVAELLAKGFSQAQIAKEVRASPATISRDIEDLRQTAIKNVEAHIEGLPHAWETAKLGLEGLIRKATEILESGKLEPGEQLDTIRILADLTLKRLDIHSSPVIMKKSIEHIQRLKTKIEQLQKTQPRYELITDVESQAGKAAVVKRTLRPITRSKQVEELPAPVV